MKSDGILVIGCGFIGRSLCRRLSHTGRPVHVITRRPASVEAESNVTPHAGNLEDKKQLDNLLAQCGTVIHLASATKPGTSGRHPEMELENLAPMLRLLEALEARPEARLIFISSGGTVYGNPEHSPVKENAPFSPLSYHGAGKVAIEAFLNAFRQSGHAVTVLRPANAYGPGQRMDHGFGFIRTALQHVIDGTTLEIWGDGESVRDFVYVDDVVEAILKVMDAETAGAVYNVGSGTGHSLNQVLTLARKICALPLNVQYRSARNMDVRKVVLDISKIGSDLEWQPSINLEEGIIRTWEWLKTHA